MTGPVDDRYEWVEVSTAEGHVWWVRGRCNHVEPEPVRDVTGELVAALCPDCDAQLPAELLAG